MYNKKTIYGTYPPDFELLYAILWPL